MRRPDAEADGRGPGGLRTATVDGGFNADAAVTHHAAQRIAGLAGDFQLVGDLLAQSFQAGFATDEDQALDLQIGEKGFMFDAAAVKFVGEILKSLGDRRRRRGRYFQRRQRRV